MIENQYDLMLFWTYRLLLYKQNITYSLNYLWFGLEWHEVDKQQIFPFLFELFL